MSVWRCWYSTVNSLETWSTFIKHRKMTWIRDAYITVTSFNCSNTTQILHFIQRRAKEIHHYMNARLNIWLQVFCWHLHFTLPNALKTCAAVPSFHSSLIKTHINNKHMPWIYLYGVKRMQFTIRRFQWRQDQTAMTAPAKLTNKIRVHPISAVALHVLGLRASFPGIKSINCLQTV